MIRLLHLLFVLAIVSCTSSPGFLYPEEETSVEYQYNPPTWSADPCFYKNNEGYVGYGVVEVKFCYPWETEV